METTTQNAEVKKTAFAIQSIENDKVFFNNGKYLSYDRERHGMYHKGNEQLMLGKIAEKQKVHKRDNKGNSMFDKNNNPVYSVIDHYKDVVVVYPLSKIIRRTLHKMKELNHYN